MIKIGLTGNIAAGKSTVKKIFDGFNIPTICADSIVHGLLENNKVIKNEIIETFRNYDILNENCIDRKQLGAIVFSNIEEKKKLEKIIHPAVISEINSFFELNKKNKIVLVDMPLLFEGDFQYLFDKILLVCANDKIRFNRIKKRNNFDDLHINKIMNSQQNQEIKKAKSDFIIFNENKTIEELEQDVRKIISEII